jgi:hypothetical protein
LLVRAGAKRQLGNAYFLWSAAGRQPLAIAKQNPIVNLNY